MVLSSKNGVFETFKNCIVNNSGKSIQFLLSNREGNYTNIFKTLQIWCEIFEHNEQNTFNNVYIHILLHNVISYLQSL